MAIKKKLSKTPSKLTKRDLVALASGSPLSFDEQIAADLKGNCPKLYTKDDAPSIFYGRPASRQHKFIWAMVFNLACSEGVSPDRCGAMATTAVLRSMIENEEYNPQDLWDQIYSKKGANAADQADAQMVALGLIEKPQRKRKGSGRGQVVYDRNVSPAASDLEDIKTMKKSVADDLMNAVDLMGDPGFEAIYEQAVNSDPYIKSNEFYGSALGVFVDGCNLVTGLLNSEYDDVAALFDSYPDAMDDLLDACNNLDGSPETQELYERVKKFRDAWVQDADDLDKLWLDIINYTCIIYPKEARYVLKLDKDGEDNTVKSIKGFPISPQDVREVFEQLKEYSTKFPNGWIPIIGAMGKIPLFIPEVMRALISKKLIIQKGAFISVNSFANPDFADFFVDETPANLDVNWKRINSPPKRVIPK